MSGANWARALAECDCPKRGKRCTVAGQARCASTWNEYARLMLVAAQKRDEAAGR